MLACAVATARRKARRSYGLTMPKAWRTKNEKARRVRPPTATIFPAAFAGNIGAPALPDQET